MIEWRQVCRGIRRNRMNTIYVTSDVSGAGKTVTAMALALAAQERGMKAGYFKPFCESPQEDADVDFAKSMAESRGGFAVVEPVGLRVNAITRATPAAVVEQAQAAVAAGGEWDVLVVEGPSLSLGDEDLSEISHHLARGLDARALVVLDYQSGAYGESMSRIEEAFGDDVLGVFVNRAIVHRAHEVEETVGSRILGVVPEDRLMMSVSLNQVAEALEGRWVWGEEQGESLVERYLIGGNFMDSGDNYFNRVSNKAVIVRGDRPDIQLSALTGPVVGMINTGGHEPVEYLLHEVEQLDVPLMVTPHRTAEAVAALGGALEGAHPYHGEKVARFLELLRGCCGIEGVLGEG